MSNMEIGKYGEKLAREYLEARGYKIIDSNYKYSRYGEIDIIALDKDELCFIEVKTRSSDKFGTPFEAVTKDKLTKIYSCIKNYTSKNSEIKYSRYRIDAISVEYNDKKPKISHIKNVEI